MKKGLPVMIIALLLSYITYAQSITLQSAEGWLETATVKWLPVSSAESYNVYYSGGGVTNQKIDDQLIRSYGSYMRADIPGLKAGSYTIKVTPVVSGSEGSGAVSSSFSVLAHDRTGFAFHNGRVPGAYKADGTPKSGAVILYITEETKNTISLDVEGATSNPCVGLQTILEGFKKGKDNRPLIIRMVGQITDFDYMLNGDIVIENKNNDAGYITLEGIGDDATADGWGIRLKNANNIELRNIGTMNCNSGEGDNIGLQQNNFYVWVHHVDFFYGDAGGDSDQAKGDGALDSKRSGYVTFSYNHFWDTGKSNLLGNGTEDPEYLSYHHNWYDHSDSRHPRIRNHSVHVYNNYYDGNSKYGVGSTKGSSVVVEGNYFRNCKYPILTSMQGSDIFDEDAGQNDAGDMATFSSEDGGSIKAANNYMVGHKRFVPYGDPNYPNSTVDFDAYVVNNITDDMPSSVQSSEGGNTHNNFNTTSIMYTYTAQTPEAAKTTVMQYAGRMNGGDFNFTFDNSVDDTSYAVNTALKSALSGYNTNLQGIQGENGGPIIDPEDPEDPEDPTDPEEPTDPVDPGDYDHNFTTSGTSSSFYSISGNLSDSKGTVNYGGLTLTQCLKIESSTSISFTTTEEATLTLVFNDTFNGDFKIDGTSQSVSSGVLTVTLASGSHTLTKDNTANLYYMSLVYAGGGTTYYSLTTTINGQGSVSPANGNFEAGSTVALTATPDSGWEFDSWSGGYTGTTATVTMNADKSITATFTPITSNITYTVSTSVVGQGTVSGDGTFADGTNISLTASASNGYYFSGWSGDGSGNSNPLSVTVNSDKNITATFTEESEETGDGYYVATNGNDSNAGTISSPFKTLQKAIASVSAGGYIYLRGGTHVMTASSIVIQKNGTAGNNIHVFAYQNEVPVLSFDDIEVSSNRGIVQDGDYWHWKGVTIEKAGDNGMLLSGNNNTIEHCVFRKNHDTGLQLSRYNTDADQISEWPSNNLIVDCEAFDNADSDSEDADGFAAKLTSGTGNIFRRCVSHHNIDDGWDLYTKSETGPIGVILFEDCIAHHNGTLTDGNTSGGGDKNGFKLGSSAHQVNHELRRCIAYSNGKHGFTDNGNIGNIKFYNLTSYDNGDYNYHTRDNASHTFRNCISLDGNHTDRIVGDAPTGCNAFDDTDTNWTISVSSSDFETLSPGSYANPTGNGFLNLKSSSSLVDAGCSAPGVSGNGTLDIGAIELGSSTEDPVYTLTTTINGQGSVSPANGTFTAGTSVSMTATPASGWQFNNWSGGYTGTTATVVMDGDKHITANFSQIGTNTTITIQEGGTGFCEVEGSVDSNNGGFTGAGFANTDNVTGKGIDWNVDFGSTSTYTFVFRYASTSNRPAQLSVNGSTVVSNINFTSTGSWTTWQTISVSTTVNMGVGALRLEATGSNGLVNIDYVEITGVNPTAVSCNSSARALSTDLGEEFDLQVYPNPASHQITVNIPDFRGDERIRIVNLMGMEVINMAAQSASSVLNISHLAQGSYVMQVQTSRSTYAKMIVKN
ncbi:Por secretion system C-terminal sorting domain-containing protein [Reichenbachiella agariperforans]|uniref:Por secretion system C-terminal sorting domain-containing protein n=1 Tax=Reichenbachiella agariperforans TaxID=156994 RepID=A0A1M6UYI6_REIAG|nr:carbohydrate-binding protein [Reichenbachiella agariperforans]SHK74116.1 Por secretion system C-terminal sorting domain-containing protein [Reichenbachiella agariperforans]